MGESAQGFDSIDLNMLHRCVEKCGVWNACEGAET